MLALIIGVERSFWDTRRVGRVLRTKIL